MEKRMAAELLLADQRFPADGPDEHGGNMSSRSGDFERQEGEESGIAAMARSIYDEKKLWPELSETQILDNLAALRAQMPDKFAMLEQMHNPKGDQTPHG